MNPPSIKIKLSIREFCEKCSPANAFQLEKDITLFLSFLKDGSISLPAEHLFPFPEKLNFQDREANVKLTIEQFDFALLEFLGSYRIPSHTELQDFYSLLEKKYGELATAKLWEKYK